MISSSEVNRGLTTADKQAKCVVLLEKIAFLSLAIVKTVALFFALFYLSGAPFIRWNFTSGLIKATDSVNREREEK